MAGYETELAFFLRQVSQMNLPFREISLDEQGLRGADMGLRSALGVPESAADWPYRLGGSVDEGVIWYITDEFACRYVVLLLPNRQLRKVLVIGPYMTEEADQQWVLKFVEDNALDPGWIPILENYYRQVGYLPNEAMLAVALQTLGAYIWGEQQFRTERVCRGVPEQWASLTIPSDPESREEILSGVQLVEQRYERENRLMEAVSRGRVQQAQLMLSRSTRSAMERRTNPARDTRNYTIILNTLLRKAAEQGGVHPVYIDRLSSEYARRIEETADWEQFMVLWQEMARGYCLLVRKHSVARYSSVIQKVITRIDFDLTADLGLRTTAKILNVNASYLSALFRQETGTTLTDYVNRKRVEHAAYLLTSTQMTVATISQSCGFSDENYFTKVFKRYNGTTPKLFRREQLGKR